MRVMLAMLGARRRYLVPEILDELGVLQTFVTDLYVGNHKWLQTVIGRVARWLHIKSLRSIGERGSNRIRRKRIVAFQWLGMRYAAAARFVRPGNVTLFASVNRKFCAKAVPYLKGADICWAYNGAAQELFEAAHDRKFRCVLEQVIAPRDDESQELQKASRDWPGWVVSRDFQPAATDPLSRREQAEWRLADMIVVGSQYVYGCLEKAGIPATRRMIVPSAIDLDRFTLGTHIRSGGPLRVLFVGQINLRKGVPYLLEAVRRLDSRQIELKLAGPVQVPISILSAFSRWATFAGPQPLSSIISCYHWADIVVVPSICEGSAMVTYEARGCGIPIVATPNAGAFFSPDVDGLEIPVRNIDAISEILDRLAGDRDELLRLRQGTIANRHLLGREAYRERIQNVLNAVACGTGFASNPCRSELKYPSLT